MKKKKIIFLLNSLEHGGTERVVTTLADAIKQKYDVKIYTLFNKHTIETSAPCRSIMNIKNPYLFFFLWPIYSLKLKKIIKKEQPDILISFLEFGNLLNITTKKKIKTIISIRAHVTDVYKTRGTRFIFIPLIKHFYKKADIALVNSENTKLDLIKNFHVKKENSRVIYNPVNIKKIEKLSNEKIEQEYIKLFDKKNKVLITVGRLTDQKAHRNLIKIIKNINSKENLKLIIVGDGALKAELSGIIKKWKLENKVILIGDKTNPFKYLKKADIFVFTSFYEGLPNAMLEAMACSLPVISTDCKTGPREILSPNTNVEKTTKTDENAKYGILCPPFNQKINPLDNEKLSDEEKVFKKALENLINNPALTKSYSQKSGQRVKDFDKDKIVEKFIKFIEEQT